MTHEDFSKEMESIFNSHKAAKAYKPEYGHIIQICEWPLLTIKDIK